MEVNQMSKLAKYFLAGLPLMALFLFYYQNVAMQFDEFVCGRDLLDLETIKRLFNYHGFGGSVPFEGMYLVGYLMLSGYVLLAVGELFLIGKALNVVRVTGGIILLGGYVSFYFAEVHLFCFYGFWMPSILLLIYFCVAYNSLGNEAKVSADNQISIVLLVVSIFCLSFISMLYYNGRIYDVFRNSSHDELLRYATYVSYLALSANIGELICNRYLPNWKIYLGLPMALCGYIVLFFRYDSPLQFFSWGYYLSITLIIITYWWMKGNYLKGGSETEMTEYEKKNKSVEDAMRKLNQG